MGAETKTKINDARLVVGGLVAGVIMNAVSLLSAGLYVPEMMGMFPMDMLAKWAAITFVGILVSTVVGAWIYRELFCAVWRCGARAIIK